MKFLTNVDVTGFYSSFVNLDKQDFDVIIEKYEENQKLVDLLSADQKIDIRIIYLEALYQIGKYGVFLRQVDDTIEDIFRYNYSGLSGEDSFHKLLLQKATALFHQGYIREAEHVATELVKINPEETLYQALLTRIYYRKNESKFHFVKLVCLALVFISALIYGINLFVIQYFIGEYYPILFDLGFATLNSAVLVYVVGEISMFGHAVLKAKKKVKRYKKQKSPK